ncbi:MAG: hypothetical protein E7174_01160 [Firmicutes bacterium]|nr:hypothetical protein [Bacillota bacterium]
MYEAGEIVLLDNEEYVIVSILECNKITYFYLTTLTSPIKVLLAKKVEEGVIETLGSKEENEYVLARFNNLKK